MKFYLTLLLVLLIGVFSVVGMAATSGGGGAVSTVKSGGGGGRTPGLALAETVTAVTGVAISPLLGVSAVGAWHYFKEKPEKRGQLGWYAQPWFWLTGLVLVGFVALKDAGVVVIPAGLKKPADLVEAFENKVSGMVAAGALLPMLSNILDLGAWTSGGMGLGDGMAFMDGVKLQSVLVWPFAVCVFGVVWLASHAINVLILISPWGVVDAVLKSMRLAVLSTLSLLAFVNPWMGALLSLVVIFVAYRVAGWSFRCLVFGAVFSWDFFTGRRRRFRPEAGEAWCFVNPRLAGLPVRTYGRLVRGEGGELEFCYRPWLVGVEQRVVVGGGGGWAVGEGYLNPNLVRFSGGEEGEMEVVGSFPPRYRTHEQAMAMALGLRVEDVGLLRVVRAVRYWFRELFGVAPAVAAR